jgi:hypothetical protein
VRPLLLTAETQAILTRIRTYGWTLSVFGMSQSAAWRLVKARVRRRIMDAGAAVIEINMYRRHVHELVRAFRTETGEQSERRTPNSERLSSDFAPRRSQFPRSELQAARQKAGSAEAAAIAATLRPVLAARAIPGKQFVAYFAFAQKLGRLCRNYAEKTLAIAAADLIDRYEAKSLDRDALRAIAVTIFGVTDLD